MKLNLLAIAIPALLVAAGANASIEVWNKDGNKVDFYGRVKAANNITDRGQKDEGDDTSARLGMSGQTQITDSVVGYGRWEYEADAGKNSDNEVRYAFAGLNFGDLGSFDYGRNDGVLKAITAYTDVLPQFGGEASNNNWNVLSSRTKAVATYRNNNFFGLSDDFSFALQYADNGDNSYTLDGIYNGYPDGVKALSREAYGANAQWRIFDTGLTAGAGYAQSTVKGTRHNTWAGGLKYENYDLYLGANYFQSKLKKGLLTVWDNGYYRLRDVKARGFELVAQYGIDLEVGRLTPSIAYVQHKVKVDSMHFNRHNIRYYAPGYSSPMAKYVSLGATYDLNKNFSAIVEYKFNLLDRKDVGAAINTTKDRDHHENKPGTKDVLGVGLIYQF